MGETLRVIGGLLICSTDRSVDVLQPDISHCGGISEMRKIAAMAEAYDGES